MLYFLLLLPLITAKIVNITLIVKYTQLYDKQVITFNGTIPGPEIIVNENDFLNINVINLLDVPTAVHWHGQFQLSTPQSDGMPGLSQCPIQPGESFLYSFYANPSGTFFYHAHYNLQDHYGSLIVNNNINNIYKPDIDQTIMIAGWFNDNINNVWNNYYKPLNQGGGGTPVPDNIIFNEQLGYLNVNVENKKTGILRFINSGLVGFWNLTCNIPFKIIEIDGSLTQPFNTNTFMLNVAQRIVILIDLIPNLKFNLLVIKHLFRDTGTGNLLPSYKINFINGKGTNTINSFNNNPNMNLLETISLYNISIPETTYKFDWNASFTLNSEKIYVPIVNNYIFPTMTFENSYPLIYRNRNNYQVKVINIPTNNVIEIFIKVEETSEHPIHLHMNRFWIIETSDYGLVNSNVLHDTISIPIEGWARIRYIANNSRIYALHCHIGFHFMSGFTSLIVEGEQKQLDSNMTECMTNSSNKKSIGILLIILLINFIVINKE